MLEVTANEARRLALAAQGFGDPRPKMPGARHLAALIRRLGLLQLDFVNVLVPSHYLVPFSRLGPYDRAALDRAIYGGRDFTEQWAHEASDHPDGNVAAPAAPAGNPPRAALGIRRHHGRAPRIRGDRHWRPLAARAPSAPSDMPDPTHTGRRIPDPWYGTVPSAPCSRPASAAAGSP